MIGCVAAGVVAEMRLLAVVVVVVGYMSELSGIKPLDEGMLPKCYIIWRQLF
ncbi:MAG: hypothetical protein A4E49_00678 [Methanosaeta sp. PtaU1.Bin112]|nr:MAG: hypothetical protein A4E49_00678 [Methanosaeta sp. PtaU1.Bin112]